MTCLAVLFAEQRLDVVAGVKIVVMHVGKLHMKQSRALHHTSIVLRGLTKL